MNIDGEPYCTILPVFDGSFATIEVVSPGSPVANPTFDVKLARLVTGIITERGVCKASATGLYGLPGAPKRGVSRFPISSRSAQHRG